MCHISRMEAVQTSIILYFAQWSYFVRKCVNQECTLESVAVPSWPSILSKAEPKIFRSLFSLSLFLICTICHRPGFSWWIPFKDGRQVSTGTAWPSFSSPLSSEEKSSRQCPCTFPSFSVRCNLHVHTCMHAYLRPLTFDSLTLYPSPVCAVKCMHTTRRCRGIYVQVCCAH